MEGLVFGGAYLSREICVSKSIELALLLEVNLPFFALFYFVFKGNFPSTSPRGGGLYFEERFNGGYFSVTGLGGLIF